MRNRFLRFFNFPFLILILLVALALQSSLFKNVPLSYFQPDFALLFVIWVAFRRNFTEGGFFTLLAGMIVESHSSAPQGFFMICYMLIYLGIRLFVTYFLLSRWTSLSLVAMGSSLAFKGLQLLILAPYGAAGRQFFHLIIQTLPSALMAGVSALFTFPLLATFDLKTFKTEQEELELEEGF